MIAPLFVPHQVYCCHVYFFFCEIPKYVQAKSRLAYIDLDFMEVGYHTYKAGWGWWMQTDLVPSDQKFSCKWNISFFKAVPSNRLSIYLGSLLHITSSLIGHFCLNQNAILHKMLKLRLWNFKPIFYCNIFFSSFGYQFQLIFTSYK